MRRYVSKSTGNEDRIPLVAAIFVIFTAVVVVRLFYLQVVDHRSYASLATSQHSLRDTIFAKRGSIYATDTLSGSPFLLASNETLNLCYISPKEITDKEKVLSTLVSVLGVKREDIESKWNSESMYQVVAHRLTKSQSDAIEAAELKGVALQAENWRYYPENTLASAVLGFVNNEGQGNYGIEGTFNDILTGENGFLNEETDTYGVKIAFGNNGSKKAVDGSSIYLTIDRYIQGMAEKYLTETLKRHSADSGQVIVMDKTNGKILAMANGPVFDPNKYTEVKDYSLFKNKSVTDVYEPGSVFKAVTLAAGEDAGKIKPTDKFTDTGRVVLDGNAIKNSDLKAHGEVTISYVLEQSLNTGTTFVEQKLGKNLFYDYIKKFGFGTATGIEFDGEAAGKVYKPAELNEHGYATMSFGQSISTTPLQMLVSFAAIANDGVLMKPYIVDKIVTENGKEKKTIAKEVRRVISSSAASDMKEMLTNVVIKGHGKQAGVKGYKIAGKTGTAQVIKEDGTGYEDNKNIGTFIGFPVAENANFVVLAKIDNPKGVQWAESTAAPLVGQMLDFLLKYYQIPPTEPTV